MARKLFLSMWHFMMLIIVTVVLGNNQRLSAQKLSNSKKVNNSVFSYLSNSITDSSVIYIDTYLPDLTGGKKLEEEYQEAFLLFRNGNKRILSEDVLIRTRGNMRKEVCDFPPLKIKFPEKFILENALVANNKLKLVLPCGWSDGAQQRLLKEFAAYKIYEVVSDHHFSTQLVRFQFAQSNIVLYDFIGFAIEEEEDYMGRTGYRVLETGKLSTSRLDRDALLKMMLFQYLILNTDLGFENRHNMEITYASDVQQYMPIPYDFDYAGIVDHPYAIPNKGLGIRKVTEPLFLMKGVTREEMKEMRQFFQNIRDSIIETITYIPHMNQMSKDKMVQRVFAFYADLEDEASWEGKFLK